jgi:hypothetical protein
MTSQDGSAPRRIERRRAPRLGFAAGGGAISVVGARLLNISRFGMLIESPVSMVPDAVLPMRLVIAGRAADVETRVAACTPQPGLRAYGVGLEFTRLAEADRTRLEQALDGAAEQTPR